MMVQRVQTDNEVSYYTPTPQALGKKNPLSKAAISFDDMTLWLLPELQQSVGLSVPVVSRWLWSGNRTFSVVASMVVT